MHEETFADAVEEGTTGAWPYPDFSQYRCSKCGVMGVCEDGIAIFVASLCQACFDALWKEYCGHLRQCIQSVLDGESDTHASSSPVF